MLQHWYELCEPGESLGAENQKRLSSIRRLNMVLRRQTESALRGTIINAAQGHGVFEPVHLVVGSAYLPNLLVMETLVRTSLSHMRMEYRVAARMASVYFPKNAEIAADLLSTYIVGSGLEQAACGAAMQLMSHMPCPDCARHQSDAWMPFRSS